jgi:hypothetical protein
MMYSVPLMAPVFGEAGDAMRSVASRGAGEECLPGTYDNGLAAVTIGACLRARRSTRFTAAETRVTRTSCRLARAD